MEPSNGTSRPRPATRRTNRPSMPEDSSSEDDRSAGRPSPAAPALPSSTLVHSSVDGSSESQPRCGQTHDADNSDGQNIGEDGSVIGPLSIPLNGNSDDDDEDPFLTDSYGNLTTWRWSDMEAALEQHLEDEASKPMVEEEKYSKEEILKRNHDRKRRFMEYALQKYNDEEDLAGEMRFVFDEIKKEVLVVEGGMQDFYEHFNFTANYKQAGSTVLFFAEVVPHGDTCDVRCCKPLDCNDNGHCFGCKNQGHVDLRHPACKSLYNRGDEDSGLPFMLDSISEDESD
uniref:Uncharacterized protein n=1 Tax=Avena sativa TaxID=4498 RepID=A0ACD5TIS9_AVESA